MCVGVVCCGVAAYVYQDDLFFPTLTVREHLQFHAAVRMPERVAHHTKMEKVRTDRQEGRPERCNGPRRPLAVLQDQEARHGTRLGSPDRCLS